MDKVLVLAPHTDDGELGCGGTISRFVEEKKEVFYAAFSICEESVPEGFPDNILEIEVKNATQSLGVNESNLFIFKHKVRNFPRQRQEILDDMIKLRSLINPDLVLMPSNKDIHQDHKTIAEEGLRAFKRSCALGYEVPWNNMTLENNMFISLEERHIDKKVESLTHYKSQQHRSYVSEEFLKSLARVRGVQGKTTFAESFEIMRWYL
ncbi:PIG-L deacetylase family protein [Endozoicomonadaceae bacterium StTr2]